MKLALSGLLWWTGFRAISDDDYARLVIAQEFARFPSWDPSGTSWLPAPFWLQGAWYAGLGLEPWVASATSLFTSSVTVLLVFAAARCLGLRRGVALLATLLASVLPHALWLGTASVPEGYVAGLILLGMSAAGQEQLKWRAVAAAALTFAALSRYEAWVCAAGYAVFAGWDAVRSGRRGAGARALTLFGCGLLAVAGPVCWLALGAARHGDALFFARRVLAYRQALGHDSLSAVESVLHQLGLLMQGEPLLVLVCTASLIAAWRARLCLARFTRPALLAICLLGFLIIGDVRGTAPTHHPERPLLSLWLLLTLIAAWLACAAAAASRRRLPLRAAAAALAIYLAAAGTLLRSEPFAGRPAEYAIGQRAARIVPAGEKLAVLTSDYGHFAVLAGFARPRDGIVLQSHDPRQREPSPSDVLTASNLARVGASWLLAAEAELPDADRLGESWAADGGFRLIELGRSAKAR